MKKKTIPKEIDVEKNICTILFIIIYSCMCINLPSFNNVSLSPFKIKICKIIIKSFSFRWIPHYTA